MATYLDIHDIPGVKAGDVVAAHAADVRVQARDRARSSASWKRPIATMRPASIERRTAS
jgi:hypothetical protein